MPSEKRKRIEAQEYPEEQDYQTSFPPRKYKHYLACPFSKYNPGRYLSVANACTEPWGFRDIGDLKYVHISPLMEHFSDGVTAIISKECTLYSSDASSANQGSHSQRKDSLKRTQLKKQNVTTSVNHEISRPRILSGSLKSKNRDCRTGKSQEKLKKAALKAG